MYQAHFGLKRAPFKITPDTRLFYSGAQRGSVLQALSYAILSGEGIIKVIGEVGTGKTMLCRMLEIQLAQRVHTVYVANPSLSPENIVNVIAFELGLIERPGNKLEVMQTLQNWLLAQHVEGRHVVVLLEEAQSMPLETLEEIRLLSNLETEEYKLLQIVLFGQPELDEKLAQASIRQLNERIAHSFYLNPLKKNQIKDYLNFRIRSAGYHGPDLFNERIARVLAGHSKGLIRRINILADKTLLAAYADGTTRLQRKHARSAIKDSGFFGFKPKHQAIYVAGAVGLLIGLIGAVLLWRWLPPAPQQKAAGTMLETPTPLPVVPTATTATTATLEPLHNDPPPVKNDVAIQDMLVQRLQATEHWLEQADADQYSIQIMLVRQASVESLREYLQNLVGKVALEDVFIYKTVLNDEPMYGILYKAFDNKRLAQTAIRTLPGALEEHRPLLLRTVRGLRMEIARSNG